MNGDDIENVKVCFVLVLYGSDVKDVDEFQRTYLSNVADDSSVDIFPAMYQ